MTRLAPFDRLVRRARTVGLAVALTVGLAACAGSPAATFTPAGPCATDGRAPGTYPALEALVPTSLSAKAPMTLDSGRSCSNAALGSLVSHAVADLRFAGATWDEGSGYGTSIAVLALPDAALPIGWAEEFYEVGAKTARRTERIEITRPTLDAVGAVYRLDVLNDLSFQTVVVWADGPVARVVIVASPVTADTSRAAHDARVLEAVAVAASAAARSAGPSAGPAAS